MTRTHLYEAANVILTRGDRLETVCAGVQSQAVQLLMESTKPLANIDAELDISPGQLSQRGSEQLTVGSAEALAARKAEQAETQRLRREVKRLEEGEILRKAAAFSTGELCDQVRLCSS
jgi:transposase-like protein